ncbi:MAG: hypothetical protein J5693_05655 [Bacteroidales bacterium]|nr:hypothetical protein [Bacteroidales bacterium]
MKRIVTIIAAALLIAGCSDSGKNVLDFDYDSLNARALAEYEIPVHPGIPGEVPFWNQYAFKFIYAPAFGFEKVDEAGHYSYTAEAGGQFFIFTAENPNEPLTDIWSDIPVGPVHLVVQAYGSNGEALGEPQIRDFSKDDPFHGPYETEALDYAAATVKAAEYIHFSPIGQLWLKTGEPDPEYRFNSYACKIWSATVQCECFLAANKPELKEDALAVARAAAAALMKYSRPEGEPLAFFPPTYFKSAGDESLSGVLDYNQVTTMFVEAVCAAKALLDLYDATGEQQYFDFARHIAETYRNLQSEDGYWPMKVNYYTGEPTIPAPCMPTTILQLAQRLKDQYNVDGFEDMIVRSEAWLWQNTLATFNFNGQFEDVPVEGHAPFQDLTNCVAVDCIDYLLAKPDPSNAEVKVCIEMARFAEDQFTRWNAPLDVAFGSESVQDVLPFVYEQFVFQVPVDHSTAGVAMAWMRIWEQTGDPLALAKAKTLVDSLVKVQQENGRIPTVMYNEDPDNHNDIWANCTWQSIVALDRFNRIINSK